MATSQSASHQNCFNLRYLYWDNAWMIYTWNVFALSIRQSHLQSANQRLSRTQLDDVAGNKIWSRALCSKNCRTLDLVFSLNLKLTEHDAVYRSIPIFSSWHLIFLFLVNANLESRVPANPIKLTLPLVCISVTPPAKNRLHFRYNGLKTVLNFLHPVTFLNISPL